jgi:LytS/YehU family sensor histidine kinase
MVKFQNPIIKAISPSTKILHVVFLFLFYSSSAQYYYLCEQKAIDSLEALMPEARDTARIDILNKLGELYLKYNEQKFSLYASLADSLAKQKNYKRGEGMTCYNFAYKAYLDGDYIKAIENFHGAIRLFEEIDDLQSLAKTNQLMAVALFFSETDKSRAWDYIDKAIEQFHDAGDTNGEAFANYNAAGGALRIRNWQDALDYIQSYFQLIDSTGDVPILLGTAYAVMGDSYCGLGDYDQSEKYYRLAIATYNAENIEDRSVKNLIINSLGTCFAVQNLPDSALYYYFKALRMDRPLNNAYSLMLGHFTIGKTFFQQLKYDLAISHCDSSLYFAHILDSTGYHYQVDSLKNYIGHPEEIFFPTSKTRRRLYAWLYKYFNYQILHNAYMQTWQYKKAAELNIPWMAINDSLNTYYRAKEEKELQTRYETEKKEQQLQQLTEDNRFKELQLKQSRWIALGLAGIVLLIILLAIMLIRQNKLKNSQQTLLFQQRLLRTQMNPHFLFNSLASIQNFIIKEKPALASDYLSRFSKLVRQILNNSIEEWVPLEDEIDSIENYLELQKVRHRDMFDYTIEVDEAIDLETTLVPPMLAQPFIENSIEHGFKHKEGKGRMQIRFELNGKLIHFELEDDGVGRKKAAEIQQQQDKDHHSMSTRITSERLQSLNKKLRKRSTITITDLKNEKVEPEGTMVVFDMPYKS